jgi:hypothetical protein
MTDATPAADAAALGRLAKALSFLRGADDPTTVAVQKAADSARPEDIRKARAMFSRLKPGERSAALAMLGE